MDICQEFVWRHLARFCVNLFLDASFHFDAI